MKQKQKCIQLKTALEIEIKLKNYAAKQWVIKDVYNIYANTLHALMKIFFLDCCFLRLIERCVQHICNAIHALEFLSMIDRDKDGKNRDERGQFKIGS